MQTRTEKRSYNKEARQKRLNTLQKHLQKVYADKEFTVSDVKKSLALQIKQWQDNGSVKYVESELNNMIKAVGCHVVGKVNKQGKGRKPNLYHL